MTATRTRRTLKVMNRLDREYIPAVVVTDGNKTDAYAVYSFNGDVRWSNRADCTRSYRVTCRSGVPVSCNCPAGQFGKPCRHKSATRTLFMLGELTPPADHDDRNEDGKQSTEVE